MSNRFTHIRLFTAPKHLIGHDNDVCAQTHVGVKQEMLPHSIGYHVAWMYSWSVFLAHCDVNSVSSLEKQTSDLMAKYSLIDG